MKRKYTNTCSVLSAWNATWRPNRTEVFNQAGVARSTCINTGVSRGNWTTDETAANANYTFSKELAWTVTSSPTHKHTYCNKVFSLSVFCLSVRNTAASLSIFNIGSNQTENL